MEYRDTLEAEMYPDVYGGETCDQHIPRWYSYGDGDKQADFDHDSLIINPKMFPPGTKVVVKEPCCPQCDMPPYLDDGQWKCMDDDCDFDWYQWASDEYS